jgi:hypothetical protein
MVIAAPLQTETILGLMNFISDIKQFSEPSIKDAVVQLSDYAK